MNEGSPSRKHASQQPLVGIDGEGAEHRFEQYRDTVYVIDSEGTLEHVEELEPGQLGTWVEYVGSKRGWQDCRYIPDGGIAVLVERLAAQLQSAQ